MKRYLEKFNWILIGFFIIYIIYLIGEGIQKFFHLSIPGNVIGFILMFVLLKYKLIKERYIKDASHILISYLILFFIPYLVRIVTYKDIISKDFLSIVFSILGSYVVLLYFSSFVFQYFARKKDR